MYGGIQVKSYMIELTDDLSRIYEDIAIMNKKNVEECLAVILERVIRTMISQTESDKKQ